MESEKFKLCPICNEKNSPSNLECEGCGSDLTSVKVTVEGQGLGASCPSQEQLELVRKCDNCGNNNPSSARKCEKCGEDISTIFPIPSVPIIDTISYELKTIDEDFCVTFNNAEVILGRDYELKSYLKSKSYVSRKHAKLTINDGNVIIENLSKTNCTFVNNIKLQEGEHRYLTDNSEIGLGGKVINDQRQNNAAYFLFKIKR